VLALLAPALQGQPRAIEALVEHLIPVVQVRVAQTLLRWRSNLSGADLRREVEDLTQEVMSYLWQDGARVLRTWRSDGGASLEGFVALVAQRRASVLLRSESRRRCLPASDQAALDEVAEPGAAPEDIVSSRQLLALFLDRLRERLSAKGWDMFQRLYLREQPIAAICAEEATTPAAVYAWRSRLGAVIQALFCELDGEDGEDAARAEPIAAKQTEVA
jgi:DNA-directed RNA polymerase specialized sigma24 family protein